MYKIMIVCSFIIYFGLVLAGSVRSNSSIKFIAIGDWGGVPFFPYKTFVELSVGREMAYLASKFNIDFILALGDNFYFNGVKDIDDPRFKETYESAFNYDSLHVPWFVVAGNHDYYGNVSAQIAYTMRSDRWIYPDFYYRKTYKIPFSKLSIDIFMIDTIILCGNTNEKYPYAQPVLDTTNKYQSETHWLWLEKNLQSSRANYILVCGHYPVYSVALHGPTECLLKRLKPLLEKYKVTAYFSGHGHNIQHIQEKSPVGTMDYIVTGSSNFIDDSKRNIKKIPPKSLLFHWGDPFSLGAFTYVDINDKNMTVSFLLSSGKSLYTFSKGPIY